MDGNYILFIFSRGILVFKGLEGGKKQNLRGKKLKRKKN